MRSLAAALAGAFLMVLAFPPFHWGGLVLPALVMFLWAIRSAARPGLIGFVFGLAFFGGLIWWIGASQPGWIGYGALLGIEASYLAILCFWLGRRRRPAGQWWMMVVGGWALMEAARERWPAGGFSWGMAGYPWGEYSWTRGGTQWVGTSGLTVITVAIAAGAVVAIERRRVGIQLLGPAAILVGLTVAGALWPAIADGPPVRVAIVQGSTPCPFVHCPDERIITEALHLALTRRIEPGSVDLVVWSESSAVGFRTDHFGSPVDSPIGAEAVRLGASLIAGSDVVVSDTEWVNVVGAVRRDGRSEGEYLKQHPVPFGEYIPARRIFGWAEALGAASRDMIRGRGPVVFDMTFGTLGAVISFEGGFARYPRAQARAGAQLLAVATNEGGYGPSPASDQLIGMTRMRAAELGMDVIHAAVTGKSTLITEGGVVGPTTALAEATVLTGTVSLRNAGPTLYTRWGDWLQVIAISFLAWPLYKRTIVR